MNFALSTALEMATPRWIRLGSCAARGSAAGANASVGGHSSGVTVCLLTTSQMQYSLQVRCWFGAALPYGKASYPQARPVEKHVKTRIRIRSRNVIENKWASPQTSCCERRRSIDFTFRSSRRRLRPALVQSRCFEDTVAKKSSETSRFSIMLMIIKAVRAIQGEKRKTPKPQKLNSLGRFCRSGLDKSRGRKMKVTSIMLLKTNVEKMSERGLSTILLINKPVKSSSPLC